MSTDEWQQNQIYVQPSKSKCLTHSPILLENLLTALCWIFTVFPYSAYSEENSHYISRFCFHFSMLSIRVVAHFLQWAFSVGSPWTLTQWWTNCTARIITQDWSQGLASGPKWTLGERKKQLTALCLQGKNNGRKPSHDCPWVGLRHTDQGAMPSRETATPPWGHAFCRFDVARKCTAQTITCTSFIGWDYVLSK